MTNFDHTTPCSIRKAWWDRPENIRRILLAGPPLRIILFLFSARLTAIRSGGTSHFIPWLYAGAAVLSALYLIGLASGKRNQLGLAEKLTWCALTPCGRYRRATTIRLFMAKRNRVPAEDGLSEAAPVTSP